MSLEEAKRLIDDYYEEAKKKEYIQNPLAWACISIRSSCSVCLNLKNLRTFNLSSLKGDSLSSSSASKLHQIFLRLRSKSLETENFVIGQRKFKNNTGVYLQNFLQYYAKFLFPNHIGHEHRMLKAWRDVHEPRVKCKRR